MVESENGCQWRLQGGPRRGESCGAEDQMLCKKHQKKVAEYFSFRGYGYGGYATTFRDAIRWLSIEPSEEINRDVNIGSNRSYYSGPYNPRTGMRPPTDAEKMTRIEKAIEQGKRILNDCKITNTIVFLSPALLQFPTAPPFQVHTRRYTSSTSYIQAGHLVGAKGASDYYELLNNRYLQMLSRVGVFRVRLSPETEWVCENYDDVRICATTLVTNPWREIQERKNLTWAMLKEELPRMMRDSDIFTTNWELVESDMNERLTAWERFKANPDWEGANVYSRDRYRQGE